ncbi:MAG TPA: ABC transporter substrate-binding protein [Pseudonocardia sp.]|nr:ABC transporter substrate-binding protein [Pseudonocardia sp.]
MRLPLTARITALAGVAALTLAACGGGEDPSGETIIVGSANFTENQILAEIYAQALEAEGVTVERRLNIGSRETYFPGLEDGSIDLIPDYTGVLLQFVNPEATETGSDEVYAALPGALPEGLVVLDKAEAENKDAVVVTRETADRLGVTSIADLAPNCGELVFGGPPEFQERPDGIPGIAETYGCTFASYLPLDAGGPLTVAALRDGDVQAANLFTTDPAIEANDFVVLEDPQNNFAAQNVVPLINEAKASDVVREKLNAVQARLTTESLIEINTEAASDTRPPVDVVAKDWLTANGLA